MGFIPQEAKEKIANLEAENKKLKESLGNQSASKVEVKTSNTLPIILGILLILSLGYTAYDTLFSGNTKVAATEPNPRDSMVVYKDGQIEKINYVSDNGLVYRVQIGAFEGDQWKAYQTAFDNLHAYHSAEGFDKISVGAFSRVVDAQAFQQMLASLGMEFAYIVAYKDGQPLGLIEAEKIETSNSNK